MRLVQQVSRSRSFQGSDLRFAEVAVNLPSQNVEVVAGCRHVYNLHVAILDLPCHLVAFREVIRMVVAELQEPLNAGGRVLRSLPIVAVWQ